MGGNRKKSHHRKTHSALPSTYDVDLTRPAEDTLHLWRDFRFSLFEKCLLCLTGVAGTVLALCIGLSVAILASSYYEDNEVVLRSQMPRMHKPYPDHFLTSQVTRFDPDIRELDDVHYAFYTQETSDQIRLIEVVREPKQVSRSGDDSCVKIESQGVELSPPVLDFALWNRFPSRLCPDGTTEGYDNWTILKAAVNEANAFAAEKFVQVSRYHAFSQSTSTDYILEELQSTIVLRICPGSVLRAPSNERGLFINADHLRLECPEDCVLVAQQQHISFGPHARRVVIRGIEFQGASSTSIVFNHDGAEVSFEDCRWSENVSSNPKRGSVVDFNSTSIVYFYACLIDLPNQKPSQIPPAVSL